MILLKISELKEFRTVNRPTGEFIDGERVYEEITFETKYDPNIKKDTYRVIAKMIDIFIGVMIMRFCVLHNWIEVDSVVFALPVFLILMNSALETMLGSSVGKLILLIEVVDDDCKKLPILRSFGRNLYSYWLIILSMFRGSMSEKAIDYYDDRMKEKFIYIIPKRDKAKIKAMMNQTKLPKNE